MTVQHAIVAFMEDPDAIKPNPIHSTSVAQDYGFKGALIGGAIAYGWTVRTIVEALGMGWLDHGWAELKFIQPMYPGDELTAMVSDDGELSLRRGDALCMKGTVGVGDAPWLDELTRPLQKTPRERAETLPQLTLANAPVGQDLDARSIPLSRDEAEAYARDKERETLDCFFGPQARIHPSWTAQQPIHWLHHSYDYGPSIHAGSRIQHHAAAYAGQTFTMAGRCVDAYERKGHHYIVNDTLLLGESGDCLSQVRHTSVFNVAKRR